MLRALLLLSCLALLPLAPRTTAEELPEMGRELVYSSCSIRFNGAEAGNGLVLEGTAYVPLRSFLELVLGEDCRVRWEAETGTAELEAGGLAVTAEAGAEYFCANGRYLWAPGGLYNINGTVLAPVRELARLLGLELDWDREAWAVSLRGSPALPEPGSSYYGREDIYWLSRVIDSEAGNQPLGGMIGVGNVVINRKNDETGIFGRSFYDVIFQPGQFDVVRNGTIYREPGEKAVIAAKLCLEGCNTVGDCKYFVNPRIGRTEWMETHLTYVLTIADHDFYA